MVFFFLYTQSYRVSLVGYSVLESLSMVMMLLYPLYGYVTDSFSLCGTRRKAYLIVTGLVGALGYALVGLGAGDLPPGVRGWGVGGVRGVLPLWGVVAVQFGVEVANSVRSVVLDGLNVELHNFRNRLARLARGRSELPANSALMAVFGARTVGKVVANVFFGAVYFYFRGSFLAFNSVLCLASVVVACSTLDLPACPPLSSIAVLPSLQAIGNHTESSATGQLNPSGLNPSTPQPSEALNPSPSETVRPPPSEALNPPTPQPLTLPSRSPRQTLKGSLFLSIQTISLHHLWGLILVDCLSASSPNIEAGLKYFLLSQLNCSSGDFSLRNFCADGAFLLGAVAAGTFLKNSSRSATLRVAHVAGAVWAWVLVALLKDLLHWPGSRFALFAGHQGVQSLILQLRVLPFTAGFVECCPRGSEAGFLAAIGLAVNCARALSGLLGTFLLAALGVNEKNFGGLEVAAGVRAAVAMIPAVLIFVVKVPKKKAEDKGTEQGTIVD